MTSTDKAGFGGDSVAAELRAAIARIASLEEMIAELLLKNERLRQERPAVIAEHIDLTRTSPPAAKFTRADARVESSRHSAASS